MKNSNEISFQMMGGLGNILFSFATAYSISLKNNLKFKLYYNHQGYLHTDPNKYKNNLFKNFSNVENISNFEVVYEKQFNNYEIEIPKNKNVFLHGYFQSEKNFIDIRENLIEHLKPSKEFHDFIDEKNKDILNKQSVSIHVRRGNYKNLSNYHNLLSPDYYYEALKEFKNHNIFIFSDDIGYCKNIFNNYECTYIQNDFDLYDLYLMSLCNHNIIANSTFSWWGAWLNQNKNKKVIAPSLWFGPESNCNSKDIIPNNWIKI